MGVANISGNILTDSGASLSSYLPLTGGTLTGALSGTSATFSGNVGIGKASSIFALDTLLTDSSTNTIVGVAQIGRATSGTAANGIGGNIQLTAEDTAGNQRTAAYIGWSLTNASSAAPEGYMYIGARNSADALKISDSGAATFSSSVTAATESNFLGTSVNSRILVTASGVANTALGFNNSGSTVTGVSNNCGYIGVLQAYPLVFTTDSTERMRITSGGQISQTAPLADWSYVMTNSNASSPNGLYIQYLNADKNNTSNQFLYCVGGTTLRAEIRSNGGLANYSGNNVNLASDIRLKRDITLLDSEWNKLKQIEVVNFKYNDSQDETALYGAIAQQVQEVYPELVIVTREATETEPEYYGLREQPFQWITTKVLQEAMAKIEELEAKVTALENK